MQKGIVNIVVGNWAADDNKGRRGFLCPVVNKRL